MKKVERIVLEGRSAWLKRYGRPRRVRLWALSATVRLLGLPCLRPPPHRGGQGAMEVERRRLGELRAAGIRVPDVLAQGAHCLILADLGDTLAMRLRRADADEAERLLAAAVDAIAGVHARGECLGQPVARNIAVSREGEAIGFIDFEEDPRESMSLAEAQARDWLLFVSGVVRHLPFDEDVLARWLAPAFRAEQPQTRDALARVVRRLAFVRWLAAPFGRRASGLSTALHSLGIALFPLL